MMKDTELQGDLRDEYLAIQEAEKAYENTSHSAEAQYEEEQALIHEAIADEQDLTDESVDDWYTSLIIEREHYEDHKDTL